MESASLREHKHQRVRDAIVKAAHALFAERGFDEVTVTDIAERAGVGRTTFFRYFGDKQEVVFPGNEHLALGATAKPTAPIGPSLTAALARGRTLVVGYLEQITEDPELFVLHERLVEQHPELTARSLVKQRRIAEALAKQLATDGADPATAVLAAELSMACYYTGREYAHNDPNRLRDAVDGAFGRLIGSLPDVPAR